MTDRGAQLCYLETIPESLLPGARASSFVRLAFSGIPTDVSYSKSAHYINESVLGRSEPHKTYSYSGASTISFAGQLMVQGGPADDSWAKAVEAFAATQATRFISQFNPQAAGPAGLAGNVFSALRNSEASDAERIQTILAEVHEKMAWLKASQYPQYDAAGRAYPPPLYRFRYGDNFGTTALTVVITSFSAKFNPPWDVYTLLCHGITVTLSMEERNERPLGYAEARARYGTAFSSAQADSRQFSVSSRSIQDVSRSSFGL